MSHISHRAHFVTSFHATCKSSHPHIKNSVFWVCTDVRHTIRETHSHSQDRQEEVEVCRGNMRAHTPNTITGRRISKDSWIIQPRLADTHTNQLIREIRKGKKYTAQGEKFWQKNQMASAIGVSIDKWQVHNSNIVLESILFRVFVNRVYFRGERELGAAGIFSESRLRPSTEIIALL
jgi:hypothetical protein